VKEFRFGTAVEDGEVFVTTDCPDCAREEWWALRGLEAGDLLRCPCGFSARLESRHLESLQPARAGLRRRRDRR
jgi:hypothetical protein